MLPKNFPQTKRQRQVNALDRLYSAHAFWKTILDANPSEAEEKEAKSKMKNIQKAIDKTEKKIAVPVVRFTKKNRTGKLSSML